MNVQLAGFNVDTNVLREMEGITGKREDLTPEVISASYARISRDPRSIGEIRVDSKQEVEKARKSNSSIIFKMGHHSVAEHAVFNLDVVGLSRYAVEELEKFRLCSYTEKSQRYITLSDDFVIPPEIKGTKFESLFINTIKMQNEAYVKLYKALLKYVSKSNPELASNPKNQGLLEGWAKEDARYIVSIATEAQIGVTVNARNLELVLRRFASHPLVEIQELGRAIYSEIETVAPSIILFHEGNDYDRDTYTRLEKYARKIYNGASLTQEKPVTLVEYTEEGDEIVLASLFYKVLGQNYNDIKTFIYKSSDEELVEIYKTIWRDAQLYDSMLREFEYVNLTYDINLSSSCFGQLKRHRMSTITTQPYEPDRGITIPASIREINGEDYFRNVIYQTSEVYNEIYKELPLVAPYILTNAHKRRVLIRVNARELYHMSRLREDSHAQWDIRNVVSLMCQEAKSAMPLTFGLLGGKDKYNEVYKGIFGKEPSVKTVSLPNSHEIKKK